MGAPNTRIPWSVLGKLGSPLPHDCVRFLLSGDPHQLLDALWGHPEPVPHLRLALVDINMCVAPKFLPENSFHFDHPARAANDHNIVQISEDLLIALEML